MIHDYKNDIPEYDKEVLVYGRLYDNPEMKWYISKLICDSYGNNYWGCVNGIVVFAVEYWTELPKIRSLNELRTEKLNFK